MIDLKENEFAGKYIIVTGGTRGIGAGITRAFLQSGAIVIATFVHNVEAASRFQAEVAGLSGKLELKQFDISRADDVESFFNFYDESYPSLDILVNNSGIRRDAMLALMSDREWNDVMDVNLNGTFYMTKKAIPLMMKNRYGRIINISSIGGQLGLAGQANYAATKAAQIAMSKSLSKEVAKKGITVNNVCPGFIETELLDDLAPELRKSYLKDIPARRFGNVSDVAKAVQFLASKSSSYITGSSLNVAGGL